jgi:hypothetical protein
VFQISNSYVLPIIPWTYFALQPPQSWQTQINTVLHSRGKDSSSWIVSDIAAAALNVYGQQVPGDLVNNSGTGMSSSSGSSSAPTINKGKRRADGFGSGSGTGSGSGSGKRRTSGSYFCPRHGGSRSNHDDKDCYSASKKPTSFAAGPSSSSNSTTSSRSGSATSSGPRSITFLGNTNAPFRANGNNPCRYCKKPWFRGHSCAEYHQAMRASNGPSVLAIRANNGTNTSASEEEDKKVKEAMEDLNYD